MEIRAGSAYTVYDPIQIPTFRNRADKLGTIIVPDGTNTMEVEIDSTAIECVETEYEFKIRYYHLVTKAQADSETDVTFRLPENIPNRRLLIINSSSGEMNYGDHYTLSNDGWYVTIHVEHVDLEEDMILELYVYRETIGSTP
jgi:hypothetical protein